jgi:hypothetical protein
MSDDIKDMLTTDEIDEIAWTQNPWMAGGAVLFDYRLFARQIETEILARVKAEIAALEADTDVALRQLCEMAEAGKYQAEATFSPPIAHIAECRRPGEQRDE